MKGELVKVEHDSPAVQALLGDAAAIAELLEVYGAASGHLLARICRDLEKDVRRLERELAEMKNVVSGLRMDKAKLEGQLKTRFAGIDAKLSKEVG